MEAAPVAPCADGLTEAGDGSSYAGDVRVDIDIVVEVALVSDIYHAPRCQKLMRWALVVREVWCR